MEKKEINNNNDNNNVHNNYNRIILYYNNNDRNKNIYKFVGTVKIIIVINDLKNLEKMIIITKLYYYVIFLFSNKENINLYLFYIIKLYIKKQQTII